VQSPRSDQGGAGDFGREDASRLNCHGGKSSAEGSLRLLFLRGESFDRAYPRKLLLI